MHHHLAHILGTVCPGNKFWRLESWAKDRESRSYWENITEFACTIVTHGIHVLYINFRLSTIDISQMWVSISYMDGMRNSIHHALKVFELFHVVSMHMLWCFAKHNCTISITRCFQHIDRRNWYFNGCSNLDFEWIYDPTWSNRFNNPGNSQSMSSSPEKLRSPERLEDFCWTGPKVSESKNPMRKHHVFHPDLPIPSAPTWWFS